jgi:hypothetical protein
MAQRYVITTPTLGVSVHNGKRTAITIPEASVIEVGQSLDGFEGLMEVTFEGEAILMFAEDIRQRGKPAAGASV